MLGLLAFWLALLGFATAQQNYKPTTGTRSLWIPFKTISGVPRASVLGRDDSNHTTYVVSCPTGQPQCALAPNLTVTAGTDTVRWVSSTSGATSGTVEINCALTATPVTCFQNAYGGGNIRKHSGTIPASSIVYSAVDVTSLKQKTDTMPGTVTVTASPSSTSSSSTGGVETMTSGPLPMLGAIGAGLLAMAAL